MIPPSPSRLLGPSPPCVWLISGQECQNLSYVYLIICLSLYFVQKPIGILFNSWCRKAQLYIIIIIIVFNDQ